MIKNNKIPPYLVDLKIPVFYRKKEKFLSYIIDKKNKCDDCFISELLDEDNIVSCCGIDCYSCIFFNIKLKINKLQPLILYRILDKLK